MPPWKTAADLASNEKAPATRKAYASDFRIFERWCAEHGLAALPADPAAVAGFIADEASGGVKASTLGRRIAAIKYRHKTAGEASPTDDERVKTVARGARRALGLAPRKLTAATAEETIGMSTLTRGGLAGKRGRAILLLGFTMAARRSELVALDVADVEEYPKGFVSESARAKPIRKARAPPSRYAAARSRAQSPRCSMVGRCGDHIRAGVPPGSEGRPCHGQAACRQLSEPDRQGSTQASSA